MAITALEAVARLRARVDVAGDVGDPPAGYKYWWQYDDASCAISNAEMARIICEVILYSSCLGICRVSR